VTEAEVFISYSRFRWSERPDSATDADAARRWLARQVTLDLIKVVEKGIAKAGYRCWRDEPSMTPGDELARKIDAALLSCAGAVIFLDQDAIERSSWVRWESAILSWRQHIGMPVRVVPVLVGMAAEQLGEHGFGPSRIDQTLAYNVELATVDPESADYPRKLAQHARQIIKALGVLEGEPEGPISIWVSSIADCLPDNPESWRASLEPVIPRSERLRMSAYPARIVARELVVADRDTFERIVNAFYLFSFKDTRRFKRNLEPVWVPADAATGIAEVKDWSPGRRVIAVNAAEPDTGADVVRRALPQTSHRQRLELNITSTTIAGAVDEARKAIKGKWGPAPDHVAKNLGGCFVMVSCGGQWSADLAQVIGELASAYPSLTYVVMVGDSESGQCERLEPPLPENADDEAHSFEAMLCDLLEAG
jgi:hypothetical protein